MHLVAHASVGAPLADPDRRDQVEPVVGGGGGFEERRRSQVVLGGGDRLASGDARRHLGRAMPATAIGHDDLGAVVGVQDQAEDLTGGADRAGDRPGGLELGYEAADVGSFDTADRDTGAVRVLGYAIAHENGLIQAETVTPDPAKTVAAAAAIASQYPAEDVSLYLKTLLLQDPVTWAALQDVVES